MQHISEKERNAIILAIASLPTPSTQLIESLEDLIGESDETTTLILAYGSLVEKAGSKQEKRMVTFIADRIPMDTPENTGILIHILHALGNTKSPLAMEYILPYIHNDNEDVILTAVSALRFFSGLPTVQQQFLNLFHGKFSDSLVEAIINALHDGHDYKKDMVLDLQLIDGLKKVINSLENKYLQSELEHLLKATGYPTISSEVDSGSSYQKRETATWNSPNQDFDIIAPLSERMADIKNYPTNYGILWTKKIGKHEGKNQIYIQSAGGLFAGFNIDNCNFKIMGKGIVRGYILGAEGEIINILGRVANTDATINGKLYVRFIGQVLLDLNPSLPYTSQLPETHLNLFNLSHTFIVYGIPVTLGFDVGVNLGGDVEISSELSANDTTIVTGALTPKVTLIIEASTEISDPTEVG